MDFLHKSIIAVVALAIVGGAGWFTYDLYIRPKRALALEERRIKDAAERKAAEAAIDHSLAAFDATAMQAQKAAPAQARELWMAFLKNYPGSSKAAAAQAALGPLNAADLFSPSPSPNKVVHTVAKGDSLYKISRANGTSVELIARANNLPGIMLQIGQQLVVPKTDIKATVDRAAGALVLENHGEFFRSYPLISARLPALPEGTPAQSSVLETVVEAKGKRLVFGDKNYAEGKRSVILSGPAAAILTVAADTPAAQMPAGLVVSESDMAEIFVLLRRGVPVTIK
mgnify:FL=1